MGYEKFAFCASHISCSFSLNGLLEVSLPRHLNPHILREVKLYCVIQIKYSLINYVVNLYRLKAISIHSCCMLNIGMRVMHVLQSWDLPRYCINIFFYIYTTLSSNNCRFSVTSAEITLITNHLIIAYDEYHLQTPPTSDNWMRGFGAGLRRGSSARVAAGACTFFALYAASHWWA